MKLKNYLFLLTMIFAVVLVSCEEEDPESCDNFEMEGLNCPVDVDAVATLCLDGVNNAYYTYGGDKYECADAEAEDCSAAISAISVKLIEAGCSTKKSASIELIELKHANLAQKLLLEVKDKSLCN